MAIKLTCYKSNKVSKLIEYLHFEIPNEMYQYAFWNLKYLLLYQKVS